MVKILEPGTRIKWADAGPSSIPAYRDMRGTVLEADAPLQGAIALPGRAGFPVRWDCDTVNSWVAAEWVVEASE